MPEEFRFPNIERLWLPLVLDPSDHDRGEGLYFSAIGRLREGVSASRAEASSKRLDLSRGRFLGLPPLRGEAAEEVAPGERVALLRFPGAVAGLLRGDRRGAAAAREPATGAA